jgi:N-acetylglutamate synthase-like GNAT family acetyltransferase
MVLLKRLSSLLPRKKRYINDMLIRPVKESDIPAVAKVHVESWKVAFKGILSENFLEQLKAERFEKVWGDLLKRSNRLNLLIEEHKNVIGFISFEISAEEKKSTEGEIIALYIDYLSWRHGAGTSLIEQAKIHMKKNGFETAFLWTMAHNAISRSFFDKTGFILTGEQRTSERNGEHFEEVRYKIILPEIDE